MKAKDVSKRIVDINDTAVCARKEPARQGKGIELTVDTDDFSHDCGCR